MTIKLSKIEILALRALSQEDFSAGKLAEKLGAKPSFVSRVLKSLAAKGLATIEKQATLRIARLSTASHAQAFKKLSDSRMASRMEDWLSGYAMGILVVASGNGATPSLLLDEAGCSATTLYKSLKLLASAGTIKRKRGIVEITDKLLREFTDAYADNLQLVAQRSARGRNISIRVRKHVVIRTDATEVPPHFTQTGLSALANNGLEAMLTSFRDFYFNLGGQKRNVSLEESFIHALLLTTSQQHQDMTVLGIFFTRNKRRLGLGALKNFARIYLVEDAFEEIRGKAEFYEKMKGME